MFRQAMAALVLAGLLAAPAVAGGKALPKLTRETKDGVQITQENIVKLKIRRVGPPQPQPPMPSFPLNPGPSIPPN